MPNHYLTGKERRQYIRLDTVFPVQLRLETPDGKNFLSDWLQGFSCDISRGGMCLTVNKLNRELADSIKEHKSRLSLEIDIPFKKQPILAKAQAAWIRPAQDIPNKYVIGITYEEIDWKQNNIIFWYALSKKLFIPAILGVIALLTAAFLFNSSINEGLSRTNKDLIVRLINTVKDSSSARQNLDKISKEKEGLQSEISSLHSRIQEAEAKKDDLSENDQAIGDLVNTKLVELNAMVEQLNQERTALREKLGILETKESVAKVQLETLDKKKADLEEANFNKMYRWLVVHQNPRTGLISSFEGDGDIKDWAFIYDQSLAAQAYTYSSDFGRAKKMFNFFLRKAQRKDGLFYNAYYANGGEPAEFIIHAGPNIWMGLAILQYTNKTQDIGFLDLAIEIAQGVLKLQDREGGIVGGPDIKWYSTEHNLDAYAFFNMLYRVTEDEKYKQAADSVLRWLIQNTYGRSELPIKRGKGDSTIATDTYAWSIAAIGPKKLLSIGMDPVKILEFAEQNCAVDAEFLRPEGAVKIKGFDFASERHAGRGGIVSSEWTAQMVIAYRIMADYFKANGDLQSAQSYQQRADGYLAQLSNMIISSASPSGQGEGCLPYATQEYVDTGHGWYTPKGKTTGSVSGTAYALFAYYNYNPLELK